jgi:transcriptional regulator with XRE-family HTH domain
MQSLTGEELRARREALGLTMLALGVELANVLGMEKPIHWNTISRWERGKLGIRYPSTLARGLRTLENRKARRERAAQARMAS